MYLLHNSVCFACIHQLVLTFISIDAQARFICHARSFQLWWIGDSGGFRIANKLVKTVFVFSLCIFFSFLSFVRKKYSNFGVDKLASCIRMLSLNASMPRSTPSLFAGYHICMTKEKGWVKRHDIIKAFTWRSVWDSLESRKFKVIIVLNLATVDAPGVIISFLCGYMLAIIVSLRMQCVSAYIYLIGRIVISAWALTLSVRQIRHQCYNSKYLLIIN